MEKYVYIETYGCSANKNNSEILAGILKQAAYEITNNEKLADIIILNTCVVKSKTESKIKRKIQDLAKKSKRKLVIITGCMPETDAKQIKHLNPNAILLGTHHFKDIINLIRKHKEEKLSWEEQNKFLDFQKEQKINLPKLPDNKLISIIQISEGCLGNCTYCKARLAKGALFSYDINDIIKSIESDLKNGAKEIWLTSQDCANYGMDKNSLSSQNAEDQSLNESRAKRSMDNRYKDNQRLPELLNRILSLNHRFKLRLGMMDPNNVISILDHLIDIYKHPKMYKFIHIPIQSASNSVLRHMNRLYTIEQAEQIIEKFRKEFPDITIATDIIVGYPTETKEDHEKNLDFIKKFRPSVFNLSKMSIHKGTEACKFKPLPINIINKRATELMGAHRKTAQENKQKFLNKNINVFVDMKRQGFYEARDENYNIVILVGDKILGENVSVKIKDVGVHHMLGEII
ncbi:MAG: MiaB/RimO family radical SAM methylthiotransferase [Candidatus Nanoarchaeia archaeon]|nr:MiaB/RimO family radical SAM methylthiotransferase [Candidatus Nanoarchaeia archaeon]MDD5740595.1 MiaB/RimO family radical SAM methylthiotransferase [Candidatus Nanoarchaeia archaeon]